MFRNIWEVLSFELIQDLGDPEPKPWHFRPGDRVTIVLTSTGETFGTYRVTETNGNWFRIEDGRLFAQRGRYPAISGPNSRVRAARVRTDDSSSDT